MTDRIGPLPYCPGCGHEPLVKALDGALVSLQPEPKDVVIVTDIGCIGLSDRYFATSAFHGLHGRSITYACGLKLARPELTVIALKGDGGCGIGGTHLLNVARRNIGITLIVANNFNYGMTGGQHSVTTPTDGVTSTTPWGNLEGPVDLCGVAVAAGASWVYRATAFDKDLADVIATAIEHPGFAMIDVWELCTAYYVPRNRVKKSDILDLLGDHGLTRGLQVDRPRPEYGVRYREASRSAEPAARARGSIEPRHPNAVAKQTGIVIAGSAGQKIRSTGTLFAEGSLFAGLSATQKDDYPITVQTGHSVSEIIVSPGSIDYTGIDSADFLVVLSEDGLTRVRARIERLSESCVLYAEEGLELPPTRARVRRFPFSKLGRRVGRTQLATAALAALLEDSGLFPSEAFAAAIESFQSAKIAELNLKALRAGVELVRSAAGMRRAVPG
jgi:Pyruvate/2-oxoacid:ferredoxin oxidoreductase gamma subunit